MREAIDQGMKPSHPKVTIKITTSKDAHNNKIIKQSMGVSFLVVAVDKTVHIEGGYSLSDIVPNRNIPLQRHHPNNLIREGTLRLQTTSQIVFEGLEEPL